MATKLHYLLKRIEARPHSFYFLMALALFVGIMRAVFEGLFFRAQIDTAAAIGMAGFYFGIGISLTFVLVLLIPEAWERLENSVHLGLFLGIFPPFIDLALNGLQPLTRYTYFLLSDLTLFPPLWYSPSLNIPLGEAVTVWLAIAFCSLYTAIKTHSLLRSLLAFIAAYAVMFFHMAVIPSLLVKFSVGEFLSYSAADASKLRMVNAVTALLPVLHILTGIVFYLIYRRNLWPQFIRRGIHILPFALLTFLGAAVRGGGQGAYLAAAMVWLCFWTAILQNDYFDLLAGEKTATKNSVRRGDIQFFNAATLYILCWIFILKNPAVLPMLLILVLAWLYHHPDYRIKKYLYGALKIEGMWGALSLIAGFLVVPGRSLSIGELLLLAAVFGGWSVCAALKDYKDIRSDARAGNYTLYQFFHKRGIGLSRGHRIFSRLVLLLFLIPPGIYFFAGRLPEGIILILLVVIPLFFLLRGPPQRLWFQPILLVISLMLVLIIGFTYLRIPFSL
jgi:hypothetical protein